MKKLAFIFLFLISFASQAFILGAQCNFNQAHGECSVINTTSYPINCRLHIFGRTAMGYSFNGYQYAYLYPGQYAYAYVNANNPMIDPLVFVNGSAECNY